MYIRFAKGIKFQLFTNELSNLLFPRTCGACYRPLVNSERNLCTICLYNLPKTLSHLYTCELLEQKMYGRIPVSPLYSFLTFSRYGMTRELLHHIKYEGRKDLAYDIGRMYGRDLIQDNTEIHADLLVPVPVHWRRAWTRGYNQAEWFANGLSHELNIPVLADSLYRTRSMKSQTKKSRYDRWGRMEGQFTVRNNQGVINKNVWIVDDVITTGSTLAACAEELLIAGAAQIGIITLAVVR